MRINSLDLINFSRSLMDISPKICPKARRKSTLWGLGGGVYLLCYLTAEILDLVFQIVFGVLGMLLWSVPDKSVHTGDMVNRKFLCRNRSDPVTATGAEGG